MIPGKTEKPLIVKNDSRKYVIIGSLDHGMEIPSDSILELITALEDTKALMMECPEEFHQHFQPMSTELLTKASVGNVPINYLSGSRTNEEIGELVLKYAPKNIAEVFVPCLYVRNSCQLGQLPSLDSMADYITRYRGRFGFLDKDKSIRGYMKLLQFWNSQELDPIDLNDFSYDFEKFVGDIREFELWQPELKSFRDSNKGKVAVCVGEYHVPFVQDVFDGRPISKPDWKNHVYTKREDKHTPQSPELLERIYINLTEALKV